MRFISRLGRISGWCLEIDCDRFLADDYLLNIHDIFPYHWMLQITSATKTSLLHNVRIRQILFPSERLLAVKRIRILCSSVCNSVTSRHCHYYYIQLYGAESLSRRTSAQGILCILWNLKVHFIIYIGSPLDRLLGLPLTT
jgi:hypothetical protein